MKDSTVLDVMKSKEFSSMVLAHRHYDYLVGHTASRAKNPDDVFVRNYSEQEASVLFLLNRKGIEHGWRHGHMLGEAGVEIEEILASYQGRGPDSAIRISEGYFEKTEKWIPVNCHLMANYPIYNYNELTRVGVHNEMVAKWLNGTLPNLIDSDTPKSFHGRVTGFIDDLLLKEGIRIIATHYEFVFTSHEHYAAQRKLGEMSGAFEPDKGGGVIIVKTNDEKIGACAYDVDLKLIENKSGYKIETLPLWNKYF